MSPATQTAPNRDVLITSIQALAQHAHRSNIDPETLLKAFEATEKAASAVLGKPLREKTVKVEEAASSALPAAAAPTPFFTAEQIKAVLADANKIIAEQKSALETMRRGGKFENQPEKWQEHLQAAFSKNNEQITSIRALEGRFNLIDTPAVGDGLKKTAQLIDELWREIQIFHFCYVVGGINVKSSYYDHYTQNADPSKPVVLTTTFWQSIGLTSKPKVQAKLASVDFGDFSTLDRARKLYQYQADDIKEAAAAPAPSAAEPAASAATQSVQEAAQAGKEGEANK